MWTVVGLALAVAACGAAWLRSRARTATFYERDVYAMTSAIHRRYALAFACFAAIFAAGLVVEVIPVVPLLGAFAVLAIVYGTSFLRGASGEDE